MWIRKVEKLCLKTSKNAIYFDDEEEIDWDRSLLKLISSSCFESVIFFMKSGSKKRLTKIMYIIKEWYTESPKY